MTKEKAMKMLSAMDDGLLTSFVDLTGVTRYFPAKDRFQASRWLRYNRKKAQLGTARVSRTYDWVDEIYAPQEEEKDAAKN